MSESQLARQLFCPGFLGHPGIGAALDGEASAWNGFDDAAETTGRFEESELAGA